MMQKHSLAGLDYDEPHQVFPHLWANAGEFLLNGLRPLGVGESDAEAMMRDIIERCLGIEPVLPIDPRSRIHRDFGALLVDAVRAEQRLFAARGGRFPGEPVGDWPPSPLCSPHPLLAGLQAVVRDIEAEANAAEGGTKLN